MSDTTSRLALPTIAPGQAQKELAHNEALARIDALLHACVEAVGVDDPPAAPAAGQAWIVGAAPTGDWAGQAGALAAWTEGGWRFVAPVPGMTAWSRADGLLARYDRGGGDPGGWTLGVVAAQRVEVGGVQVLGARRPAVPIPAGGVTIDAEARAGIAAIVAALIGHGLVDP